MNIPFNLDPDVRVLLPDGTQRPLSTYLLPTALLMLSALLLISSLFVPYWSMTLQAPQYPDGLEVEVYLTHLEGDVDEIDALNHYMGLPPLDEGGKLERTLAPMMIVTLALLLGATVWIHNSGVCS